MFVLDATNLKLIFRNCVIRICRSYLIDIQMVLIQSNLYTEKRVTFNAVD